MVQINYYLHNNTVTGEIFMNFTYIIITYIYINYIYTYIQKYQKMLILFRKLFLAVHEARPFQPFPLPQVDNHSNLIIKVVIHIIIYNIYHNIYNGLGHNQHRYIYFYEILDLNKFYHHNGILFYGSKNSIYPL